MSALIAESGNYMDYIGRILAKINSHCVREKKIAGENLQDMEKKLASS